MKNANGREMIMTRDNAEWYTAFGAEASSEYRHAGYSRDAILGNIEASPVSDLFFSHENIDALQEAIRYKAYRASGGRHVIDRQSDMDLQQVMRGIFNERAQHLKTDVLLQVRTLNEYVLDYVVPRILTEINSYLKYRWDVTTLPVPMDRSTNMSMKGSKTLEMKYM
jgi:hypothetical protein